MLHHHLADGSSKGGGISLSRFQLFDAGEENVLLFFGMCSQLDAHSGKDLVELDEGRCVATMHIGNPFGHGMNAGKLLAEEAVVLINNIISKLGGRERGGVDGGWLSLIFFCFEGLQDRFEGNALARACLAKGELTLAAEAHVVKLEDAAEIGVACHNFADGLIGQRSARRGDG